ncbi:hypothetical protein Mycsm_01273 [Mycobacterium sp. JS623]|uniref:hypothetical protein n=1 Tax=Mycobacterium sp. JS623 TaxID=212767 RepID=UPI0002A57756|nr:hypothetical protein [Mycobacterium sp. JS623]AGB21690.1 hypothetical protein Mycsm_01273 [Mycobacterium sp. JS623]
MTPETIEAIRKRATELADAAPPFTTEQAALLVSLFRRYSTPATEASVGAQVGDKVPPRDMRASAPTTSQARACTRGTRDIGPINTIEEAKSAVAALISA